MLADLSITIAVLKLSGNQMTVEILVGIDSMIFLVSVMKFKM